MAHPLLEKAAQHTAQARAINDEFQGRDMPAEAAHQMEQHLSKASDYRKRVTREAQLSDNESWLAEPDYKHDMTGGEGIATKFGHGELMLDTERKEKERKSFVDFVRKGFAGVVPEVKADLVEDATGELIVPADYVGLIYKDLPREATLRNLAWVRPTSRNRVQIGSLNVASAGWGKLETGEGPTPIPDGLGTPPLNPRDEVRVWNLYAEVLIGVDELEDTDENIEAIIRQQLGLKIAEQEDDAFAGGTGDAAKMPFAITTGVTQGVDQAAADTYTADEIKRLKYRVPSWARRNGVYIATSEVEEAVALLKGGDGHYLLQPNTAADEPATFAGKRWYTVDGLPDNRPAVFGDPRQGYMVADRKRLTVQRLTEKYAEDGKVALLFTHRVGGDVVRPNALAVYRSAPVV
jgi:HK97 family phage major capsid protein